MQRDKIVQELKTALGLHASGRLNEASAIYEQILKEDALQVDAMHLLGVVALQKGNLARAVDLISKAIVLKPDEASFHSNLAEALRLAGHLDQARQCCLTALRLKPDYAEAANNLGLILSAQEKYKDAIDWYRNAIRFNPKFAMAHNNLGNALLQSGERVQAIEEFREALKLDPNLAEAHSNLGQVLLEDHQRDEALKHCRQAVQLRPTLAAAQNNLGNVLRETGELQQAKACYAEALRLNPNSGMTCNNIAQALQEENSLPEAIDWYKRALKLDDRSARIHANYGSALAEQEKHDEAVAAYEKALSLDSDYAEAHLGIGSVLHERGEFKAAAERMREAIRVKPNLAQAHCALGSLMEELGDFKAAEASFRQTLEFVPDHAGALGQLATLLRSKLPEGDETHIRELLTKTELPPGRSAALLFGLAHVLDSSGKYGEAAAHLEKANALRKLGREKQGMTYDPAEHAKFVGQLIETFTPEFFERTRGFGSDSERPVFIVGLPRSSTTLTEQILASHPQVYGAGELRLAREDFEALPELLQQKGPHHRMRHTAHGGCGADRCAAAPGKAGEAQRDGCAGRRQDAGQLHEPGPDRDALPARAHHPLQTRPARHRRVVLDHQLRPDPLGQRLQRHRHPLRTIPPHHVALEERAAREGPRGGLRRDGAGPGERSAQAGRVGRPRVGSRVSRVPQDGPPRAHGQRDAGPAADQHALAAALEELREGTRAAV
jgi:tetratricopeptide (TPR) repeat protein